MRIDKSLATNICAGLIVLLSWFIPSPYHHTVLNMGLFALSGAITNWLAIYMLFEKVPGIYGSGVIPLGFEEFKQSIHDLVMHQFFNVDNLEKFFQSDEGQQPKFDFKKLVDSLNLDQAFASLVEVVMESSIGSMLKMFGGAEALSPLKEPFIAKMKEYLMGVADSDALRKVVKDSLQSQSSKDSLLNIVQTIVAKRLDELSPQQVKKIVQKMIKKHLGWLVVWGGVIGGVIGFLVSLPWNSLV